MVLPPPAGGAQRRLQGPRPRRAGQGSSGCLHRARRCLLSVQQPGVTDSCPGTESSLAQLLRAVLSSAPPALPRRSSSPRAAPLPCLRLSQHPRGGRRRALPLLPAGGERDVPWPGGQSQARRRGEAWRAGKHRARQPHGAGTGRASLACGAERSWVLLGAAWVPRQWRAPCLSSFSS